MISPRVRILAFGTLHPFAPLFIKSTGVDLNAGLFYTAGAIASFSVRLFTGRASDRFGRSLFMIISLVIYTVAIADQLGYRDMFGYAAMLVFLPFLIFICLAKT